MSHQERDPDPEREPAHTTPRLGSIVADREVTADSTGLVVDVTDTPACEYPITISGTRFDRDNYTVADRDAPKGYPEDDPVVIAIFASDLDRSFPNWKDEPMTAVIAYRQGSFTNATRPYSQSRLKPILGTGIEDTSGDRS